MCFRVNVGIDPERYGGFTAHLARNTVDDSQFRFRLHVEGENTGLQSIPNLGLRLADTGVYDPLGRYSSPESAEQFSAGNDVGADTPFGKQ